MNIVLDSKSLGGLWFVFPDRVATLVESIIPKDSRGMYPVPVKGGELFIKAIRPKGTSYVYHMFTANVARGIEKFGTLTRGELETFSKENDLDVESILEVND